MAEDSTDDTVPDNPADELPDPGQELVDQLPDSDEVPSYVRRMFWSAVALTNGALLATSLGIILFIVAPDWRVEALGLIGIGIVCAAGVYVRYRQFKNRHSQSA